MCNLYSAWMVVQNLGEHVHYTLIIFGNPATYIQMYSIVLLHVSCTEGGISGPGAYNDGTHIVK